MLIQDQKMEERPSHRRYLGAELEKGKGIAAAKFLIENGADVLPTKKVGQGPFHVLRDDFVKIYKIPESLDIRQVLEAYEKEELEPTTF